NGKQYYRVNAALSLNTDLAPYIMQVFDLKPEDTNLKAIPLKLKQSIDFDLDMATRRTVSAVSTTEGGFTVSVTSVQEAAEEQKISGQTEMRLLSAGIAATPIKPQPKHGGGHGK
ncbi:MAG TPA: hypothetical protein VMI31_01950, partial [Fimbriimonadaceae bacterium]|nr:hypothetical protein [Fimbriimonadaceae bacterium]